MIMGGILDDGKEAEEAAGEWLKANSGVLDAWLVGVTSVDGGDAAAAVKGRLGE
jgi:glycine betaine/proline transport system substrate-binding protein